MKAHWQARLLEIEDLSQRRLLRNILLAAFTNIESYTEAQLAAIKQRVFDESQPADKQINLYTALLPLTEYDASNDFLFPMNPDDLKAQTLTGKTLTHADERQELPVLGKRYFALAYPQLQEIQQRLVGKIFNGQLTTNLATYEIKVSLAKHTGYCQQVEKLYELQLANNIAWKSVLHPSIYKFMEIRLESEIRLNQAEEIAEVVVDFEEFEQYQQADQIPLWNIKTTPLASQGFSMPLGDRISYEHELPLQATPRKLNYLLDGGATAKNLISTQIRADKLIITTTVATISNWQLWLIINPLAEDLTVKGLLSNRQAESFINNFANRQARILRTLGEIQRLARAFVDVVDIVLVAVETDLPNFATSSEQSYEVNPFVKDEIRRKDDKKVLKLKFTTTQQTSNTLDLISFLTSEIALYFPEYRCVGELI